MDKENTLYIVYRLRPEENLQISSVSGIVYDIMHDIASKKKGNVCIIPKEILNTLDKRYRNKLDLLYLNDQKVLKDLLEKCKKHDSKNS